MRRSPSRWRSRDPRSFAYAFGRESIPSPTIVASPSRLESDVRLFDGQRLAVDPQPPQARGEHLHDEHRVKGRLRVSLTPVTPATNAGTLGARADRV